MASHQSLIHGWRGLNTDQPKKHKQAKTSWRQQIKEQYEPMINKEKMEDKRRQNTFKKQILKRERDSELWYVADEMGLFQF